MLYYGNSDVGMKRQINQDSFMTIPIWGGEGLLLVVCDGMGGHKAGDIASKTAVERFTNFLFKCEPPDPESEDKTVFAFIKYQLVAACDDANRSVFIMSEENIDYHGMGTTLVAALIYRGCMYAINIGDSRLYKITYNRIKQVSTDHSFVQNLIEAGKLTEEEAKTYPRRNVITKALGVVEKNDVDFFFSDLNGKGGGYLLLCTDGLTNYLDKNTIYDVVYGTEMPETETVSDLASKVNRLISIANGSGGSDNITAVLCRFD